MPYKDEMRKAGLPPEKRLIFLRAYCLTIFCCLHYKMKCEQDKDLSASTSTISSMDRDGFLKKKH